MNQFFRIAIYYVILCEKLHKKRASPLSSFSKLPSEARVEVFSINQNIKRQQPLIKF
jgi:hypothetical protein